MQEKNNEIENLAPLTNLLKVKTLYLDNNKITDLKALQNLNKLEELSLNYNYIEKDLIGYMFNDNIDIDKYKEIHIWKQLSTNSTYNMINYIPEGNNKFLNISRNISRNISIKSFDDIYILIDSSYEIILKRSMSVIIDCLTKKISKKSSLQKN
mgnify:CR=1 FL=1